VPPGKEERQGGGGEVFYYLNTLCVSANAQGGALKKIFRKTREVEEDGISAERNSSGK